MTITPIDLLAAGRALSTEKTGSEKRATVYETARMLADNYAGWMIGLVIEAAAARLRASK